MPEIAAIDDHLDVWISCGDLAENRSRLIRRCVVDEDVFVTILFLGLKDRTNPRIQFSNVALFVIARRDDANEVARGDQRVTHRKGESLGSNNPVCHESGSRSPSETSARISQQGAMMFSGIMAVESRLPSICAHGISDSNR